MPIVDTDWFILYLPEHKSPILFRYGGVNDYDITKNADIERLIM